jgi:hypothetical protein
MTIHISWLLLFSYSMIICINTTLYNCSCDCCIFILCRVFIVCVVLCTVLRLIVVLFCVICVICVLCLIVVPLPLGETPFAVKINNNNSVNAILNRAWIRRNLSLSVNFSNHEKTDSKLSLIKTNANKDQDLMEKILSEYLKQGKIYPCA